MMRWDGWMRSGLKTLAAVLAVGIMGDLAFGEQPYALYYLGLAYRGQGLKDAPTAKQKFALAAERFAAAAAGFAATPKTAATPGRELPVEIEWTARAKCDEADVLIRSDKFKEAMAIVEPM